MVEEKRAARGDGEGVSVMEADGWYVGNRKATRTWRGTRHRGRRLLAGNSGDIRDSSRILVAPQQG